MAFDKDELKRVIKEFVVDGTDKSVPQVEAEDRTQAASVLYEVLREQETVVRQNPKAAEQLISNWYACESDSVSDCVARFFAEAKANEIAGVFYHDEQLAGELKNRYMFDLIEMIRFAKMQRESLRDTASYNRHIEKALGDMKNNLVVLLQLKSTQEELLPVLAKYYEFTKNVNTAKVWVKFHSLYRYDTFELFLKQIKSELLGTYKRGTLRAEALKSYIERGDADAMETYMETLMETALDDRNKTEEMISCNVAFPLEDAFLINFVALFAPEGDHAAAMDYFLHSTDEAAENGFDWLEHNAERMVSAKEQEQISAYRAKKKPTAYSAEKWLR